ncbi:MAG: AgmX/PglI C-terminal domain-containing protein [Deltaproteobacteria bacterium]
MAVRADERHLRVALVWAGALHWEQTYTRPQPVVLPESVLPLESARGRQTLLVPSGAGYTLHLIEGLGGSVWLSGQRRELDELGGPTPLGPDDYGVVTIGGVALFFQMVKAAPRGSRRPLGFDAAFLATALLSIFIHASIGLVMKIARDEAPASDPLELPTELVRRFMVTPPPEDLVEPERRAGGTGVEDPGLADREEAGGRQAEDDEGRVGRQDAQQEQTEMEGEINGGAAARVRSMGLLGVLAQPNTDGSPLAALTEGPSVSDILGGLGSSRTVSGRGSGGSSLRGSGAGGGGTGPGTLLGGGGVGTGVGVGNGAGGGRGRGGAGAPGRGRGEVAVRVQTERPRVSGYLSPEQIMRVVRQNSAAIRYCYESELQRQPSLRGRIEIGWRINREGRVTTSRVARSTMDNARVEGCIVRQVRNWRFDQPDGGEVDVVFPFLFGATGG